VSLLVVLVDGAGRPSSAFRFPRLSVVFESDSTSVLTVLRDVGNKGMIREKKKMQEKMQEKE